MRSPLILKPGADDRPSHRERGMTILLVAVAMVAIIGMAALSIDIITLYLAKEQAQRAADAGALAAARVISVSGLTGDPANATLSWQAVCGSGTTTSSATAAAVAVATQSEGGGTAASPPTVTYSIAGSDAASSTDCSTLGAAFGVNPMVTVQITRANMPTFFSRIWGNTGNTITASATAEAFNPSNSGVVTNGGATGSVTPVQPSCVKPWVVPNLDPLNPSGGKYCGTFPGETGTQCNTLVSTADGSITNGGVLQNGKGVIGENFWLYADCRLGNPNACILHNYSGGALQPTANYNQNGAKIPNLLYVPNQVGTPVVAIPSCTDGDQSDPYQQAIEGCDAPTNYQCGVTNGNIVDMGRNPRTSDTTMNGVLCLTRQSDTGNTTSASGQDYLAAGPTSFGQPGSYPFQILAGSSNPLNAGVAGNPITASNSIVSLPIYDTATTINNTGTTTAVTFVGFLQVFINAVDSGGNVNVTVLNVAGCSSNTSNSAVNGSSPVPVRLITPQ